MQIRQRTKFVVVETEKTELANETTGLHYDYICNVDPETIHSTRKLVQYVCQLQGCVHTLEAQQHAMTNT